MLSGWWLSPTPLKNDGVKVSWDDVLPNWMDSHEIPWFQTTRRVDLTGPFLVHGIPCTQSLLLGFHARVRDGMVRILADVDPSWCPRKSLRDFGTGNPWEIPRILDVNLSQNHKFHHIVDLFWVYFFHVEKQTESVCHKTPACWPFLRGVLKGGHCLRTQNMGPLRTGCKRGVSIFGIRNTKGIHGHLWHSIPKTDPEFDPGSGWEISELNGGLTGNLIYI